MGLLSRQDLLKKVKLEIKRVDFDDGSHVFVKEMNGHEKDKLEASMLVLKIDKDGNRDYEQTLEDFRSKLAVATVCDEKGKLILKPSDVDTLSQNISAKKLSKIAEVSQEVNKITEQDRRNLLKNSKPDQSANSTSA